VRRSIVVLLTLAHFACGDGVPKPPDVPPDAVPKIITFDAARTQLYPHETTELRWVVENAQRIEIIAGEQSTIASTFEPSGSADTGEMIETTTFVLRATNREKVATAILEVTVEWGPPQIFFFRPTRTFIVEGTRVELEWHVENALEIALFIDGVQQLRREPGPFVEHAAFVAKDEQRVALEASNPTDTASITLEIISSAIVDFSITPRVFTAESSSAAFAWSTRMLSTVELTFQDAATLEIQSVPGFPGTRQGMVDLPVHTNGAYFLIAGNDDGGVQRTVLVEEAIPEREPNATNELSTTFRFGSSPPRRSTRTAIFGSARQASAVAAATSTRRSA
jgi:hypothetical protein